MAICVYSWAKQGILYIEEILLEEGIFFKFSVKEAL